MYGPYTLFNVCSIEYVDRDIPADEIPTSKERPLAPLIPTVSKPPDENCPVQLPWPFWIGISKTFGSSGIGSAKESELPAFVRKKRGTAVEEEHKAILIDRGFSGMSGIAHDVCGPCVLKDDTWFRGSVCLDSATGSVAHTRSKREYGNIVISSSPCK